jgi:TRAP-type C4-dicarboxylate transport system permease small subunit
MIFGMSLAPAYAAIPVAAGLAALQMLLVLIRDLGEQKTEDQMEV